MTLSDIEIICKATRTKEEFKKYIDFLSLLSENEKLLIWRVIVPYKIFPLYQKKRFKFVWGGRWGAKTHSICKILLYLSFQKKYRILCTREIQNTLAESVHAELRQLIEELHYYNDFEITKDGIINIHTGAEFIFKGLQNQMRTQTIKSLAGVDICWVEEAQTISKTSLDILIPTIRKNSSELWFSYNRLFPDDPIEILRQSIQETDKIEININAYDNLFNSVETLKDIQRLKEQYDKGENQDYLHVVLGEPLGFSTYTVLSAREVQQAIDRQIPDEGEIVVGIDIARMGGDKTIFVKRKGLKMIDYKMFSNITGDLLFNEIINFVNNDVNVKINIDETGIAGGYIADMLKSKGFKNVFSINFGGVAKNPDKYNNVISEMWFEFKSKINNIQLLNIQELKSQLITREYKYDNKERKCVEPKESYKKRGYKSPDFADAVLLCYYENKIKDNLFVNVGIRY